MGTIGIQDGAALFVPALVEQWQHLIRPLSLGVPKAFLNRCAALVRV